MLETNFRGLEGSRRNRESSQDSAGELLYVPIAKTLCIADSNFERREVINSDGVEGHIQDDQGPLAKGIFRVSSGRAVDLMLDVQVDHGYDSGKESSSKTLPMFDRSGIRGTQRDASDGPGESCNYVGDHEDVMPVMVIGRGDIGEASACQGPKDSRCGNKLRQRLSATGREKIPQPHEGESWSGCYGNEEHEKGSFGIAIADRSGNGGEPFLRVAIEFILDDLVIMEREADDERTYKGDIGEDRMSS